MRPSLAAAALGVVLALAGGAFDAEPLFVGGIAFVVLAAVASAAWVALAARGARVERDGRQPARRRGRGAAGAHRRRDAAAHPRGRDRRAAAGRARAAARRAPPRADPHRGALRPPRAAAARAAAPGPPRPAGPGHARAWSRATTAPVEVLVLPRTEPVEVRAERDASGAGRALAALAGAAEVELDGLRAYRPGSPASRIHWPPLARGAGLLERRLRPDGDGRPLVVLDPARPGRPEDLDAAVRAAASLVIALARGARLRRPAARASAGRPASSATSAPGPRCGRGWRWSRRARRRRWPGWPPAPVRCSTSPRAAPVRLPRALDRRRARASSWSRVSCRAARRSSAWRAAAATPSAARARAAPPAATATGRAGGRGRA